MNPDAGAVLADHVLAAQAGSLPEASRKRTAELVLDAIGIPARVPAHHAALVNSALTRAMELDDVAQIARPTVPS